MKVKFNKTAFQEALTLAASVVPNRTPKPILQCLRITSETDSVRICATDLEVGISYRITQVEVEREGDIVVPAEKIASIVRESVDEVIELESTEATVHIRGADSHFTIYGHEAEQYPAVPGFDVETDFEMDLAGLQRGIEQTVFAAAKESTRYALNGILWEVKGKKLTLVATDGRRLAKSIVGLVSSASNKVMKERPIVPSKAMLLLDKVGADEGAKVAVHFMENQIILACEQVVISSNLVEGNFPKYEDIIPSDNEKKIVLSTNATISAVRRAALLTDEESKGIKLALSSKGTLVFSSRAPETGDAQVDMKVDYSGEPLEVGFNPQFLIEALRVIKTEDLEFNLGDSDRPGMIKGGSDFLYIVMPVNL